MSVAPVSDWAFYDSIYTERYMSTPELNRLGYAESQISSMAGFHHADYLLAHGSGDDNGSYIVSHTQGSHSR
jgi:dipeptidyl aminopeptidase